MRNSDPIQGTFATSYIELAYIRNCIFSLRLEPIFPLLPSGLWMRRQILAEHGLDPSILIHDITANRARIPHSVQLLFVANPDNRTAFGVSRKHNTHRVDPRVATTGTTVSCSRRAQGQQQQQCRESFYPLFQKHHFICGATLTFDTLDSATQWYVQFAIIVQRSDGKKL